MEFVTVRELRVNTGQVWKTLEEEKELVITSSGKPIAILTNVSSQNLEPLLNAIRLERGKQAIRNIRKASMERGLDKMTMEEIDAEIKAVRRERRHENRR